MVVIRKRKKNIVNEEKLKKAIRYVIDKTMNLSEAAGVFGIIKNTLDVRINVIKNN